VAGEGGQRKTGSPEVAASDNHELVEVEVEEAEDVASELTEAEEAPLTVGDMVDGAKDLVGNLGTGIRRIVDKGRYRKIRVTRNGKQVIPDIPLAAAAALEAASLYGAGFARVLGVNVAARFLFDFEVVNEADKYFKAGTEAFLEGDLERAEQSLLKAVRIDDTHAGAYLQLGVLYRLQGELEKAEKVLDRAHGLDDAGEIGKKANDILRQIRRETE
jgi:tetratricopeptide (TPR) repeat protein